MATPLQRYRDAVTAREALGAPAPFPDGADATFAAADAALARAKIERGLLDGALATATTKLGDITLAPLVVAHKPRIEALAARQAVFDKAVADLPGVVQELATLQEVIATAARHLRWPETAPDAVQARIPSALLREDLARLLKREQALVHAVETATTARNGKVAGIATLTGHIDAAPKGDGLPLLTKGLAAARALNHADASAAARTTLQTAQRQQAEDFAALMPWQGGADALRGQNAPTQEEVTRFTAQRSSLEALRGSVTTDIQIKEQALELARAQLAHHEGEHEAVSAADLLRQREQRDALWSELRHGDKSLDAHGAAYEEEVRSADTLADRRYDHADHLAKGRELRETVLKLETEMQSLGRRATDLDDQLEAQAREWHERVSACGVFLSLDRYPAWSKARDSALASARATTAAADAHTALAGRAEDIAMDLRAGLVEAGAGVTETELLALVTRAEAVLDAYNADRARLAGWIADREAHTQQLPALETALESATTALQGWQVEHTTLLAATGLPADTGSAGAEKALALFTELEQNCRLAAGLVRRTTAMEAEVAGFTQEAQALVAACAPDFAGHTAVEMTVELTRRRREAERAATDHQQFSAAIEETQGQIAANDRAEAAAAAQLAPLLSAAKVATHDELRLALAQWTACRNGDAAVKSAREAVINNGDGLPFASLEAEVAEEDLNLLDTVLATVRETLAGAKPKLTAAVEVRTKAQAALAQYAGQDTAVRAEADRQDALLLMREAAEGHLRLALSAKLLAWAVNRYSERKHEPLLKAASGIFAKLTLGAFDRLAVAHEDLTMTLYAYRPDGSHIAIGKGLSTGTEAQLYLALRLASLEQQLATGAVLPFLGDDLFMGFDKPRCAAAIEVLADLSTRTQVILLTHDEDIAKLAATVAAGHVNVIELPRE